MRSLVIVLLALVAFTLADDIIPGEYVVMLRHGVTDDDFSRHVKNLKGNYTLASGSNEVLNVFQIGSQFKALHLRLTDEMVRATIVDPMVSVVEPNRIYRANQACHVQRNCIWNLDRIDEREIDLVDPDYHFDSECADVTAYIIDTGILLTHVEFGGRATFGFNSVDGNNADCNGHGTHVASTVGGTLYGVCKQIKLVAVKVLNCGGSGTTAGVINGVNWVASNARGKSLANMSLGGGYSATMNAAVDAAVDAGVSMVIAAGNSNQDACNFSPASAEKAVCVGATTLIENGNYEQEDRRASFSNYGECVTVFAPGQTIQGAWIGSNTATNIISGTSMASPHTAGVAALILARAANDTPAQVKGKIGTDSTPDVVDLACTNNQCRASPNKFIYTGNCN